MLSANEIRQALKSNNGIAEAYEAVTGKPLNRSCGDCIRDAKIVLQASLNEIERESSPLHLYLIDPSEETIWQNEQLGFDKITIVDSEQSAFLLFEDNAVNIISQDAFFDSTLSVVKQIKTYQAYVLDCYKWNGNGHAIIEKGSPCVWIFRGKLKKQISLSGLKGYIVSNPYGDVHALRLTL